MRMQPKQVLGATAAVLALTVSAGAAASPGGTTAVSVSARHATADTRFTELLALAQVKRDVAWAAVERAWGWQAPGDASRFAELRALGQVKRDVAWAAVERAWGG
jgi:hypothetical protein